MQESKIHGLDSLEKEMVPTPVFLPRESHGQRKEPGGLQSIGLLIEKAREFQKNIYFCFTDYTKAFVWITTNCGKFLKRWEYQATLSVS